MWYRQPISAVKPLPKADYNSCDVYSSPLSDYFRYGRQQEYLIRFWLNIFQTVTRSYVQEKNKLTFLKVCKIQKFTWYFQTDWILCVLNCSGWSHVVNDAGSMCPCYWLFVASNLYKSRPSPARIVPQFQQWKLLCLWKYTHKISWFCWLNEKDMNYQDLQMKLRLKTIDESPPERHLRQRFCVGDWPAVGVHLYMIRATIDEQPLKPWCSLG